VDWLVFGKTRKCAIGSESKSTEPASLLYILIAILMFVFLANCGVKGPPRPPKDTSCAKTVSVDGGTALDGGK